MIKRKIMVRITDFLLKTRAKLSREDRAAGLGSVSLVITLAVLALIVAIGFAIYFDYNQLASIGLGIINAFASLVTSIPNVITNFIYGVGTAITNLITGAINNSGTAIVNAWNAFVNWLSGVFSHA